MGRHRFLWWKQDSQGKFEFRPFICFLTFYNSFINILIAVTIAFSFMFGKWGQVNTGILASLFNLQSFFCAALFYWAFREKITKSHFVGMVLLFLCIVFLAVEASKKQVLKQQTSGLVE